jgi:general secretion pathway protein G
MMPPRVWSPYRSEPMKTVSQCRRASGFTLVELLTVIAIIMILAGLTVGGLSFYNRKVAEDKTRLQLKLLAAGLEAYFGENGEYPLADDANGKGNTDKLYEALFYDTDNDGNSYQDDDDQEIFLPELDPASNSQGWIAGTGENVKLIDGFGNEYRYRRMTNPTEMRNPDFDLWSMGADGKTNATTIVDPENKDDLWER